MQFKANSSEENFFGEGSYLVDVRISDHLVGRMCQIIEMLGLPSTQEKATKDTVREQIYDAFSWDKGTRHVDGKLVSVIATINQKEEEYARSQNQPSGMIGEYELIKTIK